ncbi:MAG: hypothetical protein A2Z20_01640 [Bdellovibrionales bacterium RBG_16_40_8]|nr:MAG: hypothetical protein A2Z20_01640 [Bdellovibrionales bacterium RBG_16_40_8]
MTAGAMAAAFLSGADEDDLPLNTPSLQAWLSAAMPPQLTLLGQHLNSQVAQHTAQHYGTADWYGFTSLE